MITSIAAVSYTATALLTYEVLVEANDVRVLPRADRIRGHATMATWAVCWPVACALCVGAAMHNKLDAIIRRVREADKR